MITADGPSRDDVTGLELAWHRNVAGTPAAPQPIVWAGKGMRKPLVYVTDGTRLEALTLGTGRVRWAARGVAGPEPVADGDLLIDYAPSRVIRRYVPISGHIVWQRTFGTIQVSQPVLGDGLFVLHDGEGVRALDARTGRELWFRDWDAFHCTPALAAGRLFVAGNADALPAKKGLYALDPKTGRTMWSATSKTEYDEVSSPVVFGDTVYVRTMGGVFKARTFVIDAYRTTDGKHLWTASVGRATGFWFTAPAVDGSTLVYPSEDGNLYALDATTGSLRWRIASGNNNVSPAIVNGIVWNADGPGHLVAFDERNGRVLWRSNEVIVDPAAENISGSNTTSPIVAGPFVLTTTTDGQLLAYRVPRRSP